MFGEKLNLKYKQFTMLHTEFKQIVCVSMIVGVYVRKIIRP